MKSGKTTSSPNPPTTFGALSSQGVPVIASTASAPPTPMANIPKPEALGVCESVPSLNTARSPRRNIMIRDRHAHQHPRSGVVFQDDLVDNSGARLPEFDPVLLGCAFQEVEHLLVGYNGALFRRSEAFHGVQRNVVTSRSACAPLEAWIRWSQCMLTGTAHRERPALMNCNLPIPVSELRQRRHQDGGLQSHSEQHLTDQ